ncbi:MAG: metal-dependent hydrolase [Rhizobiales bacterium]|nr:metal-dependent hydrolase [Hyphomicrobiales bacterium]
MANFRTHAIVGIVGSGMLATLTMAANVVPPAELVTLAFAGALGSVLPDVDLKNSRASQALFTGIALFVAFTLLFKLSWQYSIAEMWIIWIGAFAFVRFGLHSIFHNFTRHRGIFHSVLAGLFFSLIAVFVQVKVFGSDPALGWLAGAFVMAGYLTHLLLDEIYSVDFDDSRVKRSFGSALKLFDGEDRLGSLAMAVLVAGLFYLSPPSERFVGAITSPQIWALLGERLLPEGAWFGFAGDLAGGFGSGDAAVQNGAQVGHAAGGHVAQGPTDGAAEPRVR